MSESRISLYVAAAVVTGGALFSAVLLANSLNRVRSGNDSIRVTGSARRIVRSDYIIWTAKVRNQAATASEAYQGLQAGVAKMNAYLTAKGIPASEIFPLSITTEPLYDRPANPAMGNMSDVYRKVAGFELSQSVEVRSQQVELVQGVSRTVTDLINQGVSVASDAPQYRITKLPDLKDAILAEAAQNARTRAMNIAKSGGATLGGMKYSHMGAMTVTPAYADQEKDGTEDTESLDKKVTVQVTSAYAIR